MADRDLVVDAVCTTDTFNAKKHLKGFRRLTKMRCIICAESRDALRW